MEGNPGPLPPARQNGSSNQEVCPAPCLVRDRFQDLVSRRSLRGAKRASPTGVSAQLWGHSFRAPPGLCAQGTAGARLVAGGVSRARIPATRFSPSRPPLTPSWAASGPVLWVSRTEQCPGQRCKRTGGLTLPPVYVELSGKPLACGASVSLHPRSLIFMQRPLYTATVLCTVG